MKVLNREKVAAREGSESNIPFYETFRLNAIDPKEGTSLHRSGPIINPHLDAFYRIKHTGFPFDRM